MSEARTETYAEALLGLARAEGAEAAVADELYRVAREIDGNAELRSTLTDASLPADRRTKVVTDVLGGKVAPATLAALSAVVASGRADELGAIADALAASSAGSAGKALTTVRTAVALSDDQQQRLATALEAAAGRPIEPRFVVDPEVVGGVHAEIGDQVIDGSVRSRLIQLRELF
ncbi:MAG: ATP synthase F1 subunit delta [Microthrixaceae bacterium]